MVVVELAARRRVELFSLRREWFEATKDGESSTSEEKSQPEAADEMSRLEEAKREAAANLKLESIIIGTPPGE